MSDRTQTTTTPKVRNTMQPVRQGDVYLQPVSDLPNGPAEAIVPESGRLILAYGEATGHHHSVAVADAEMIEVTTADAVERYLRVHRETTIDHQEHPSITLAPGTYQIVRHREYQPAELPRYVAD